jgi:hypothetical protein
MIMSEIKYKYKKPIQIEDTITAPDGKIYTDGVIYGKVIRLGTGVTEEQFRLITQEEYDALFPEELEESLEDEIIEEANLLE